ncbi:hypothetical protein CL616_03305 [archaeon]|nr:hypothetical protein [archaeon]|tara:strand:- start:1214 stop:1879 length:666 start_codon:yes stop_codon:yes gene_type:complete
MVVLTTGPQWFGGYDILFNIVFAIVTLFIAGLSYKAKHLTKEKKYSYFGLSFLLAGLAFLLFVIFSLFQNNQFLLNILATFDFVFFLHMFLILLSYLILSIIILKITNKNVMALLLILILLFVLFSFQYFVKFHIISFVLLAFLTYQFYKNYQKKRNINTKFVFVSFFLLTSSHIFFAAIRASQALYIAGEVLQLLGYILLFLMLMRLVTHGRPKGKIRNN